MSNSSYAPVLRDDDDHPNIPSAGDLGQNLVGPPAGQAVPAATSIPLMQVVAPATLPEGYEFMAALGDRTVKVVVPPGGVEQGQKFEVPFPQHLETALTGVSVPVGHWRDGILDIFHYGVCHPACWTSSACHLRTYKLRQATRPCAAVIVRPIFRTRPLTHPLPHLPHHRLLSQSRRAKSFLVSS